jgi:hypothetical protein
LYDQVYEDILAECLDREQLFEDPKFPSNKSSFYKKNSEMKPRVVYNWLRPGVSVPPALPKTYTVGQVPVCNV